MDYLISVVVPVYNMENTVNRCIKSIIRQTYSNIEIIIINDGSTDNSNNVIIEAIGHDERVKYISRENRGLSVSYREGIDNAKGDFIIFVDSDDYIALDMIENLLEAQHSSNADIVQSGIIYETVQGKMISKFLITERVYDSKKELFIDYFLTNKINRTFAGNLIKTSLIDQIEFIQGAMSIDLQVMPFIFEKSEKFIQINQYYYHAVMYMNSVSRGTITDRMYEDKILTNKILQEDFFHKLHPELEDIMYYRYSIVSAMMYIKILNNSKIITKPRDKLEWCKRCFNCNYKFLRSSWVKEMISKKDWYKMKIFKISPLLLKNLLTLYSIKINK